ncbi:YcaO-like family protein [Devosia sp. SL43]|uniref:YcaO-like family protein n=1 Tax=Devosia sp. SL43 TaxID=2806348 RepID=UPI001F48C995|nr:YcaO-like family protein [Devosia sp. SL43]
MSSGDYSDRICPPEQTLSRLAPHLAAYGITRIARQTSLDTIGIPVFASFRPNALTLATNQGKGLTDEAAKASAAMEAMECAIAEQPECDIVIATAADLVAQGRSVYRSTGTLPAGETFPRDRPISWVQGTNLSNGDACFIPLDVVRFSGRAADLPGICQHTNGLASGNCIEEAFFHGLCELIERDAGTLWAITPPDHRAARQIDPATLDDPQVDRLVDMIAMAGFSLMLFDQTTDLGIPTVMAEIWPVGRARPGLFEVSSGSGTHPVSVRAALRAITEAAQSRVTTIAGARDDIEPSGYGSDAPPTRINPAPVGRLTSGLALGTPLERMTEHMLTQLARHGIHDVLCVPLGGDRVGISVVKVLAEGLEDWGVNLNWTPGTRALACLAALRS